MNFVLQAEQRGTGHALMVAQPALSGYDHVIVLSGDAPQITPQTIAHLLNFHLDQQAAMTLLSADLDHPTGYGRMLFRKSPQTNSAEVQAIVEEKAASPAQKKIHEINAGFYVFAAPQLFSQIAKTLHRQPPRRVLPHRYGRNPAPGQAASRSLENRKPRRSSRRQHARRTLFH